MKQRVVSAVLWLAFGLAMASSVSHLAWAFGRFEFSGGEWVGWLAALAVDGGLAALAYSIQQRRRAKRPALVLWCGVGGFTVISAAANLYHALATVAGAAVTMASIGGIDSLTGAMAGLLSATLPALVLYLGEVVSSDDANAAMVAERERLRAAALAARAETERQRAPVEAPVETKPEPVAVVQAPVAEKRRPTVADWRAIAAGLNGQRATLDATGVNALLESAGMAAVPETTARRWAIMARGGE